MKVLITLFFIFSLNNLSHSQKINIDWTTETKAKNGMDPKKILGEWNNELYVLKDDYSSAGIHHYYSLEVYSSPDMQLISCVELKLPDINERGNKRMIDIFLMKNGNLVLFFDNDNKKIPVPFVGQDIEYKCFVTLLNKKAKSIDEPQLLFEHTYLNDSNKDNSIKCGVIMSTDSSTFFMYQSNIKNKKIVGKLIDSELKTIKPVSFDTKSEKSFVLSNLILDEKKVLYGISKENAVEYKKHTYKIMSFNLLTNAFKSVPIDIKTNFPLARFHMIKYINKLQIIGYYFNGMKKRQLVVGFCIMNLLRIT